MQQYVPATLVNNVFSPPRLPEITKRTIICGVVEGFYGRPWTLEQRKHLFGRLHRLGMSTYLYAPKDDIKHRAEWRKLYDREEAAILKDLITSATENNVTFVYALSPGLDIVYSLKKELDCIKEKLDQVRSLGCNSFALLFDDIETNMHELDKKRFSSFASAQVSVTNEIYDYLDEPEFFFCPTEYCETRAIPTLLDSLYLKTVGTKLKNKIHVLWTGPRVISRFLTVEHIRVVARVLGRKPVIWDNLHANDYDPKRVFMGPFAGRPVALKDEIAGLLLNPNCKYESNFVPLHTLSDWNACDADAPQIQEPVAVLEAGGRSPVASLAVDSAKPVNLYHPLHSLRNAIRLWIDEFNNNNSGPSIPPVRRVEANGDKLSESSAETSEMTSSSQEHTIQLEDCIQAVVQTPTEEMQPINSLSVGYVEPMDTRPFGTDDLSDDITDLVNAPEDAMDAEEKPVKVTDYEQVATLVDMFFLPFECGRRAAEILEQFAWIHENAHVMVDDCDSPREVVDVTQTEWRRRFHTMCGIVDNLRQIFRYITECHNKPLVSEMIPYAWEAHGACAVLLAVAQWFERGLIIRTPDEQSRFWNTPREEEPWTISYGFISNIYTLLSGSSDVIDLYNNKGLLPLSIIDYVIRPLGEDEFSYLCSLASAEECRTDVQNELNKNLYYDKFVNVYLRSDPRYTFLVEDQTNADAIKLMCFGSASFNGRKLKEDIKEHLNDLDSKYRNQTVDGVDMDHLAGEIAAWFPDVPDEVFDLYPAWMDIRFNVNGYEAVPAKKLVHTISTTLAMNDSAGVFVSVPADEVEKIQFFGRIGFGELGKTHDERFVLLGHSLLSQKVPEEVAQEDIS